MRIACLTSTALVSATLLLSACGGGGSPSASAEGGPARARGEETAPPLVQPEESVGITPVEAARLAKQASFGPTPQLIDSIVAQGGAEAWINHQLTLRSSTYADIAAKPVPTNYCAGKTGQELTDCNRDNYSVVPMAMRFYANALGQDDQLRQRAAFALSQILVASDLEVHTTAGLATYNQILLDNAFGNYRDLLAGITLNPFMGNFLDMGDSHKATPNENYARELMQLFSLGTALLNPDGTRQVDAGGAPLPAYSNADVKEVSRALTGWTWARLDGAPLSDYAKLDYTKPMVINASRFDTGAKTFLGKSIPAGASQQANVDAVLDAVFHHPNTGPFVSKRLIQQLVTANPTPAYVARVAAKFADNGAGVRGDMKAVIKAILIDTEARETAPFPGKIKEPVLVATSLARALGFTSDGYALYTRDAQMGQRPFSAPSVFNYYPYDFPLPLGDGAVSPVSKLMTTSTSIARHNFIYDWTIAGEQTRGEFQPQAAIAGSTGTKLGWASWEALAANEAQMLDRINLLLLNGTMTGAQRQALSSAMAAVKNNDPALQARRRAQVALYITASSPLFQVDR